MLGPCAAVGVQLNRPLPGLILAPGGGASKLKLSTFAGTSTSSAVMVNVSVLSSLIVLSKIGSSTGALFTSFTTTVKLFAALKLGDPLSLTRTLIVFVLGPCVSLGVQVNIPVAGLMLAPAGAPASRL